MSKFIIKGGKPLRGEIAISGSKNATLPIFSACLLTTEESVIKNVPDILDVHMFLDLLKELGVEASFQDHVVRIKAQHIDKKPILDKRIKKMRASILLLGSLLSRLKEVQIDFPGGCVLGKRTIYPHEFAVSKLGADFEEKNGIITVRAKRLKGNFIVLPEISVTATENAILAAVLAKGQTKIHLAACEPHVQDLCYFLLKMGANISGIGTHFLTIKGVTDLHGATYAVVSDYLETGTCAVASIITKGEVTLTNIVPKHLDSFWQKLRETGANFELTDTKGFFYPTNKFRAVEKLQTAVYPGFATDLQAPFAVLLTQAEGKSLIFETLFEGRLNYLFELEKMGATVNIVNPYLAYINGKSRLEGCPIASCDIRAGAAMVLAGLVAEGTTEISNINYIDRGYEKLEGKLRGVGAEIERV